MSGKLAKKHHCAVACQNILHKVLKNNKVSEGVSCIITGDYKVGEWMTQDKRVPLVSATGSTRMGKIVGAAVAEKIRKRACSNWVVIMLSS